MLNKLWSVLLLYLLMAGELSECPFCGSFFELGEIEEHVSLHLLDSEAQPETALGHATNADVRHANHVSTEHVACPFGCGALVALDELDSHEEAHRCVTSINHVLP